MGSSESEVGRQKFDWCGKETPHSVTISQPFYMATTETTQSQWQELMGAQPSKFSAHGEYSDDVKGMETDHFPVENVSWDEVQEYLQKLNTKDAEQLQSQFGEKIVYALPTEAQWEYAIRGGTTSPFGIGVILNGTQANMDGRDPYGTDIAGPLLNRPVNVGSYPANAWGIHDGHGNVWEWCEDGWEDDLSSAPVTDPIIRNDQDLRVDRGGSFDNIPALCRAAHRGSYERQRHSGYVGFRIILRFPQPTTAQDVQEIR